MRRPELSHAEWRTSSYSGANGSCVEVAPLPGAIADGAVTAGSGEAGGMIAVRDSKDRGGPALVLTARQWRSFAAGIKAGELNLS
jgi:Domain of unknown function (DUF397)